MANVQVRGVPDDLHRRLKALAAGQGQSLNEFLLAQMGDIARLPTNAELIERIRAREPYDGPPVAPLIQAERDRR